MPVVPIVLVALVVAVGVLLVLRRKAEGVPAAASEEPSVGPKRNWLIGIGGDVKGRTFHLGTRVVSIGRKPSNFIQTTDRDASRNHCGLRSTPAGILLTDMRSRNGTYVNGSQVREATLKDGDQVRIGEAIWVFQTEIGVQRDDSQRAKTIDATTTDATAAAGNLTVVIAKTLHECGGDTAEAARRMNIPEQMLISLVKGNHQ